MIYLDTHVAIWLFAGRDTSFPERARKVLETEDLLISPVTYLEMELLFETGKIRPHAEEIYQYLQGKIGLQFSSVLFPEVARKATLLSWTRDPFDRLIVADALAADAPLVTKDQDILSHYPKALWGD